MIFVVVVFIPSENPFFFLLLFLIPNVRLWVVNSHKTEITSKVYQSISSHCPKPSQALSKRQQEIISHLPSPIHQSTSLPLNLALTVFGIQGRACSSKLQILWQVHNRVPTWRGRNANTLVSDTEDALRDPAACVLQPFNESWMDDQLTRYVTLAGAATSIIFVAPNTCRYKNDTCGSSLSLA